MSPFAAPKPVMRKLRSEISVKNRVSESSLEAGTGIEPVFMDLQSSA